MCTAHGAGAAQVREAAQRRLLAMVHPALDALRKLIDQADSDSVRISAIRDILDRTGFKPTLQLETEQEIVIRVIDEERPLGYLSAREPERTNNGHATHPTR